MFVVSSSGCNPNYFRVAKSTAAVPVDRRKSAPMVSCDWLLAGLDRSAFDNKTVSFEEHCTKEHNMWHYLFFIILVKVKDPTEFTGPESYVYSLIQVGLQLPLSYFDHSRFCVKSVELLWQSTVHITARLCRLLCITAVVLAVAKVMETTDSPPPVAPKPLIDFEETWNI